MGASPTTPLLLAAGEFAVVDTGDPLPDGFDAVVMREQVHREGDAAELRAAATPYQHVRSIGEDISATELLLPEGHRLRSVDVAAAAAAGVTELVVHRRPVVADRSRRATRSARPGTALAGGEIPDTNSLMLAGQAREAGCEAVTLPIAPDDPDRIAAAVREAAARSDLVIVVAGSSARPRRPHRRRRRRRRARWPCTASRCGPGTRWCSAPSTATPVLGAPGYPVSAALTFDIFAAPLLAGLGGLRCARAAAGPGAARTQAGVDARAWTTGSACASAPSVATWSPRRCPRGAGVLTSLVRADGLLVVPAGLEGHHPGEVVDVELLRGVGEIDRTIVAVGSHDLVLDLAASALRAIDPRVTLASSNVGSLGGLVALRDGLCHLAGSHLLDPDTGEYTLPYVDRVLGRDAAVVRLAHREQGLIVAAGNPLALAGLDDLARPGVRYVNRQRGAGTRVLLDCELRARGIDGAAIAGYGREEHTHLAVAATVAAGRADCGLGVLAAARAFGLGFVPVTREPYDLVLAPEGPEDPKLAPLWALLDDPGFKAAVRDLGGYEVEEMGRRIR